MISFASVSVCFHIEFSRTCLVFCRGIDPEFRFDIVSAFCSLISVEDMLNSTFGNIQPIYNRYKRKCADSLQF